MGERTLLKLKDDSEYILLYLHWFNKEDCKLAAEQTAKFKRNNIDELSKFVAYFIKDHDENASIYVVPQGKTSYGESQHCEIDIKEVL